jgi:hypothetical protein
MIQVHSVTAALYTLLSSDAVLVSSGFVIEEGEALNRNVQRAPWAGVYYGPCALGPHVVGGTQPWRAELDLLVYVQEASHISGQDATRRLGQAQAAVLDVLNANRTLGGTVLMLTDLSVSPYRRDLEHDSWLFTNEIGVKAELRG